VKPGTRGLVTDGPFTNFKGVVVGETGGKLEVELDVFGRKTRVTLKPTEFQSEDQQFNLEDLEPQVEGAVRERGFRYRAFLWWCERILEDAPKTDAELVELGKRFEPVQQQLDQQAHAAVEAALAKLHAEFGGLSPDALTAKWHSEKEHWLETRSVLRELNAEFVARHGDKLPGGDLSGELVSQVGKLMRRALTLAARAKREAAGGFVLTATVPRAGHPELEAMIETDPERVENYLAYADWLQAQGDPRGELIAVQAPQPHHSATALAYRSQKLLTRHREYLLGGLADLDTALELKWELGFIKSAHVATSRQDEEDGLELAQVLGALLALPSARFLRGLALGCPSVHEQGVLQAIHEALEHAGVRPTLRELSFETDEEEEMLSWTHAGPLRHLAMLYPRLRSLRVHAGGFELSDGAEFAQLRELILQNCSLSADNLAGLQATRWPSLERLELWAGGRSYGVTLTADDVLAALRPELFPKLVHLGLANLEFTDELCRRLPESALMAQLTSLDLSMGTMTDAGAEALLAHAPRLQHLERLSVRSNYLSSEAIASLASLNVHVEADDQREAEDGSEYRYAAVGE